MDFASFRRRILVGAAIAPLSLGSAALAQNAPEPQSQPRPQPAPGPSAQSPAETAAVGEIVVTARRREERLQEVPVAVTYITADALRARNIQTVQDLATITPGLQANPGSGQGRYAASFSIRGQGPSGSGVSGSGVASYLFDVPEFGGVGDGSALPSSAVPPTVEVFDMDNVQVLKGPQGTLFGRVTTGGAVLFTPRGPTNQFEGFINERLGSYDERDTEFGIGGPIIPGLFGVRIAGVTHYNQGNSYDLYNGSHLDGQDNQSFRATAKLTLGNLDSTLLYQYSRNDDPQKSESLGKVVLQPIINRPLPKPIAALANIACTPDCPTWYTVETQQLAAQQQRSPYVTNVNAVGPNYEYVRSGFINVTNYRVNDQISFKNIASWRSLDYTSPGFTDSDGGALPVVDVGVLPVKGPRTTTEEIQMQLDPVRALQVTAGFYYEHNLDAQYSRSVVDTVGGFPSSLAAPTAASTPAQIAAYNTCAANPQNDVSSGYCHVYAGYTTRVARNESLDQAAYIQGVWQILPKLKFTAGYRYTDAMRRTWNAPTVTSVQLRAKGLPSEMYQIPGSIPDLIPANPGSFIAGVVPVSVVNKVGTYTFALDYKLSDHVLVYGTTRSGFKPGGFNNAAPAGLIDFGPENVTDYEVGVKTNWRLGGVSGLLNVDVFRDNYTNIQGTQFALVNNVLTSFTTNVAVARIQGFDLEGAVKFNRLFDINAFYSYLDARYLSWPNTGQTAGVPLTFDYTTNKLPNAPTNQVGVTPAFHVQGLNEQYPDITVSGNLSYQSSYAFISLNSTIEPENIIPGRTLVNLRADWRRVFDTNASIGLAVTNAFNNQGRLGGNNQTLATGQAFFTYLPPRIIYVDLHYAF